MCFFLLIFTQPGFSLHAMVFLRFLCSFLCWGGMGDEHGSILSLCILGVFAFWPFLGTFLALFGFQWPFGHFESTSDWKEFKAMEEPCKQT